MANNTNAKPLESWLWDAACSIRGAQDKLLLVNASQVFAKGDPKNSTPEDGIERVASTFLGWQEEDEFSRIVDRAEIVAELDAIEAEARETDVALRQILEKIGVCTPWLPRGKRDLESSLFPATYDCFQGNLPKYTQFSIDTVRLW